MLETQSIKPRGWHIGVDEAGRGCLAGPVAAGAVLVPPAFDWEEFPGLNDSKALSESKRDQLRALILGREGRADRDARDPRGVKDGFYWSVGFAWPEEIDRVNILNATFRAMTRAVCSLLARVRRLEPGLAEALLVRTDQDDLSDDRGFCLYIDGSQSILLPQWQAAQTASIRTGSQETVKGESRPGSERKGLFDLPRQITVVGGDALIPAISAASILAKTQRDLLMRALDKRWPIYGFRKHKGYGTKEHMASLRENGLCPLHRRTFCKGLEQTAVESDQFSLFK